MFETNQNNLNYFRHTHNGTDSPLIENQAIANALNAPQSALTAAGSTVAGGGAAVLTNADADAINNIRTRVIELETKLQAMGLLA